MPGHDGQIAMLTLTVRHNAAHDLKRLRAGLTEAWSAMWRSRRGRVLRASVAHYVRALDVTWGLDNGWHPHIHALLFSERGDLDAVWLEDLSELWADAVGQHLGVDFRPRTDEIGCHLTLDPPRAEYLLKLGLEVASISTKHAKPGRHSPWEIARESVQEQAEHRQDRHWRRLWQRWVRGMHGARHLSWSRHLRSAADLEPEAEQLELDLELIKDDGWILSIRACDWQATFGNWSLRKSWSYVRRPSVLLARTRKGLAETLSYLRHVGLVPVDSWTIEHSRRTYTVVSVRRKTAQLLQRMQL